MADRELKIRVRAEGAERTQRMLRGLVQTAKRGDGEVRRSRNDTAKAAEKAERAALRAAERAERGKVRAAERAERERTRLVQHRAREEQRAAQAAERERARAMQSMDRTRARGLDSMGHFNRRASDPRMGAFHRPGRSGGRMSSFLGGIGSRSGEMMGAMGLPTSFAGALTSMVTALAAVAQDLGRVTTALERVAGERPHEEQIATAQLLEAATTNLVAEAYAGESPAVQARERDRIMEESLALSRSSGRDPLEVVGALQSSMTRFGRRGYDATQENMAALVQEARRLDMPVEELADFQNMMNQAFGANGPISAQRMMDFTAQAGLDGSLSPQDLTRNFGGFANNYQAFVDPNRAASAEENLRSFTGVAQALAQVDPKDPTVGANLFENLINGLNRAEVQNDIALATGGRVTGHRRNALGEREDVITGGIQLSSYRDDRGVLDISRFVEDLQATGQFDSFEEIGRVTNDMQVKSALAAVISARARNLSDDENYTDIGEIEGADAEAGGAFRERHLELKAGTSADRMALEAARSTADAIDGGEGEIQRAERSQAMRNVLEERTRGTLAHGFMGEDSFMGEQIAELGSWFAETDVGQAMLNNETARRHMREGTFGVVGHVAEAGQTRQEQGALALENQTVDRLAQRIGQEVERAIASAQNPANRQPGQ